MDKQVQVRANFALLIVLVILPLAAPPAAALYNPAALYCTALNYTYTIVTGPDGMTGYCVMPDNQKVEAWAFLQGKEATQYSYCTKAGYALETTTDPATCKVFMTESCAVCVQPDGSKTEVTKLMGLNFREKLCSNGKCCDPAKDTSCSFSTYPPGMVNTIVILAVIVIIAAGVLVFIYIRKKRGDKPETRE